LLDNPTYFPFLLAYFWTNSVAMNFCFVCAFALLWFLSMNSFHPKSRLPFERIAAQAQCKDSLPKNDSFLEHLLTEYLDPFARAMTQNDSLNIQIIYTQIDRDAHNTPSFTDYYFHVDRNRYFYPASCAKLPVALLALQKLNELRLPGLDKNSSLITEDDYSGQTSVLNDPTAKDGRPTIAQYIKKIFLVSDNDAYNRLYEFLGPEYINDQLRRMGYTGAQIRHRFALPLSVDENLHTNPVTFYDASGKILYHQPMQYDTQPWPQRHDSVGHGYLTNEGLLIDRPMDFSNKNRIALEDLHRMLRSVLFPSSVEEAQRFKIKDEEYDFLYRYMSSYPSESTFPSYDTTQFWDGFSKFLYWGSAKGKFPKSIRIFNKEGDAYGFLTDLSYLVDFDHRIEFMLSCSIYCNSDGIINDNKYDYDSVGLPFMKALGQAIYSYELKRQRPFIPNLISFRLNYDK
jgi:hypothetical protein